MPHAALMVRFCLDKAAECRRAADRSMDSSRKQRWLEMEGQWFFLARSYDTQRRTDRLPEQQSSHGQAGRLGL
jgi:hypothetical protein